jgi:signal transduction histidine kinase
MKDKQIDIAEVIEHLFFCHPDDRYIPPLECGYHSAHAVEIQTLSHNLAEMIGRAIPIESIHVFIIDERTAALSEVPTRDALESTPIPEGMAEQLNELGLAEHDRAFEVPAALNLPVAVIVPLKMNLRLIGFIALGPKRFGQAFDNDDLEYLTTMAELTVVAFDNARLSKVIQDLSATLDQKVSARTKHLVELNQQLTEQHAQLQTLDELKESLTRMVVHDLKNPLGTILLGLEYLECNQIEQMPPELVQHTLSILTATAQEMQDLIANLLDVNRMEAGCLQLKKELTSIYDIILEGLNRVQVLAQSHKVRFELDCQPDLKVVLDRGLMTRVIVNLLVNAVKFAKRETEVHIGAYPESDTGLRLIMTNHGQVIPAEALPRLFDKFFQVQSKNLGLMSGNGLGLTFCKMVTKEHGGRIEVASPVPGWGDGARFTLILSGGP